MASKEKMSHQSWKDQLIDDDDGTSGFETAQSLLPPSQATGTPEVESPLVLHSLIATTCFDYLAWILLD